MRRVFSMVPVIFPALVVFFLYACATSTPADGGVETDTGIDAELPDAAADAGDGGHETDSGHPDAGDAGEQADSGGDKDAEPDGGAPDSSVDSGYDGGYDAGDSGNPYAGAPWFGCTGNPVPAGSIIVTAFDQAEQYFSPTDRRTVDSIVQFPETGKWGYIAMVLRLECLAPGMCDPWDRIANVSIVEHPGEADEGLIELERYITPYGTGLCFEADETRFSPIMKGQRTIRSFIDTWTGGGKGYRVTLNFIFEPGVIINGPFKVVNLIGPKTVTVGDPANPVPPQLAIPDVTIAETFSYAEVRAIITGHGQGNLYNCGEFCNLGNTLLVNGNGGKQLHVWRSDCAYNPTGPEQKGSWTYDRDGWCPGAYVTTWSSNITPWLKTGEPNKFQADVVMFNGAAYENSCRPGQGGPDNICTGCEFSTSAGNCDYNGGNHTPPVMQTTYQLFVYP